MRTPFFLAITLLVALTGCKSMTPRPGLSLAEAKMAEGPVLIQRGERFYLHYRRDVDPSGMTLQSVLKSRRIGDGAYYYFTGPVSAPEWGNIIERPLAFDGYEDLARRGRIFWLDPGGKTNAIPIRRE